MADDIPHFPQVKVDRSLVTSYTAVSHSFWLESKTNTSGKSIISSLSSAQLRKPARSQKVEAQMRRIKIVVLLLLM